MANVFSIPGPNSKYQLPCARLAGIWAGLWQCLICPITFLVSLYYPGVRIYEIHNRGRLYDFGFLHAASSALGESGSQAEEVRRAL